MIKLFALFTLISPLSVWGVWGRAPEDFVSIKNADSDILVDVKYFGENNFVGEKIDGYQAPYCVLSAPAAKALKHAQEIAKERGFGLKVFDCYRPQTAVDHFVRWAKDLENIKMKERYYPFVKKDMLFEEGYIAEKSGHSRGSTVDLTLVDREGEEVPMGTRFDYFDPLSHTESREIAPENLKNRLLLKGIMEEAGFKNYAKEWWHYTLKNEPHSDTYFSFPVR